MNLTGMRNIFPTKRRTADGCPTRPLTATLATLPAVRSSNTIDTIEDPDGPVRLIRVRGVLDWRTLQHLIKGVHGLSPSRFVHLDLVDATIVDAKTMGHLERVVDALEQQQVGVRIVGLDPYHPALIG